MKRFVLAVIALTVFAGFGSIASAQEYKGPRVLFDQLTYNVGKVVQGTQVEHVFDIRNVGQEDLVIERIQPG